MCANLFGAASAEGTIQPNGDARIAWGAATQQRWVCRKFKKGRWSVTICVFVFVRITSPCFRFQPVNRTRNSTQNMDHGVAPAVRCSCDVFFL